MISVEFTDHGEIRMGSPFNVYSIKLAGEGVPDLPEHDWQNTYTASPDGRYLVLTSWEVTGNRPGFYFVLIDSVGQNYLRTDVFQGCCTKLEWAEDGIDWEAWCINGERSGKLPHPGTTP